MSDEGRVRKRVPKSCQRCYRRKQRCVGYPTCSNCELAKQPCARSEAVSSWHHAMSKGALVRRIEQLEEQLSAASQQSPYTPSSHHRSPSSRDIPDKGHGELNELDSVDDLHLIMKQPVFMGPSSGLTVVDNLSNVLQDTFWPRSIPVYGSYQHSHQGFPGDDQSSGATTPDDICGLRLLKAYFDNTHVRLPFLDRGMILRLHARRNEDVGAATQDRWGRFKLFSLYAIGATILRMTETYSATAPNAFLAEACKWKPPSIELQPLERAESLMLMIVFHLRGSSTSRVWHMLGQAMRICTDHGLHCKSRYQTFQPYDAQLHLRLFWSIYLVERYFCWSSGRPFSIAESEIDADLPADVEITTKNGDDLAMFDNITAGEELHNPINADESMQGYSLQRFVACIKLQRLVSSFKNRVYRVGHHASALVPEIAPFMCALENYKDGLPLLSPGDHDFVHMHWNNCIRVLLQPFLSVLSPFDPWIKACITASGRTCQSFKRLRQRGFGYSFLLANSIFVAGMTMCLCLLRSPHLWTTVISNDLRACSSAMSVMAEHNASLKRYRDTLEVIIERTMDFVNHAGITHQNTVPPEDISSDSHTLLATPPSDCHRDWTMDWLNLDVPWLDIPYTSQSCPNAPNAEHNLAAKPSIDDIFSEDMWAMNGFIS